MVITLTRATSNGTNRYFLSQGKSITSANKNVYKTMCQTFNTLFGYQSSKVDLLLDLYNKFTRWQEDGSDSWEDPNSWYCRFPNFTFPRTNEAKVIEIEEVMYEAILSELF